MKYMQMKYMWLALAAPLFLTACTEEDDHASVPEYTKFDYPEWTAAARPEIALPPTDWTVAFGGGMETPDWQPAQAAPMTAPGWQNPDMHVYPASMTAIIRTSDYIRPDITADDRLAAFIGTECRGVAEQIEGADGETLYLLQVKADQSEVDEVEFRYYSARKQEIFIASERVSFEADITMGSVDTPTEMTWNSQGELPYYMDVEVSVDLSSFDDATVADGDMVAAFVGDECRGMDTAETDDNGNFVFRFRMWGRNVSEQFAFKYYTATLKDVYTYEVPFYMQHTGKQTLNINLDEHGFMDLYVRLPETLRPYMREGDDMAAFVNGYPCSIVQDRLQENYMLKMKGRKGDKVSFRFYSDSLKHVFATPDCVTYADAGTWGNTTDYQTLPLETAFKLVNMRAVFAVEHYEAINTTLAEGDLLAAFVGDECRGVAKAELYDGQLIYDMQVVGTLGVNEEFVLKYYHPGNRYMFTCNKVFDFEAGGAIGSRNQPMGITLQVIE